MAKAKKSPPATPAQIAAQEFEPIDFDPLSIPSAERLNDPYLISLRLAAITVGKTKSELIDIVRTMGGDRPDGGDLPELVSRMQAAQAFFAGALRIVEAAELRLMVATHAAVGPAGLGAR